MRSRASDVMTGNNTRSRSVDRVSNSTIDLSRLSRSITETSNSSRFNSLNRIRGSQKTSLDNNTMPKKQAGSLTGSNTSICSTLPVRGRFNNGRGGNKYNFKTDPCYTSNIDHLVSANSTRSSFNVKYGGNFPLSKSMERRMEETKKQMQQKVMANKSTRDNFQRQQTSTSVAKNKSALNTSSGGSKSFDVFQRSTSPRTSQQSNQQSINRTAPIREQSFNRNQQSRSKLPNPSVSNVPGPSVISRGNNGAKYTSPATKQQQIVYKQQSSEGTKPINNTAVTRSRIEQQCSPQFEDASMLQHANNVTTTILQETTPNRRNNVSILQVRSVSEPNSNPQTTITKHQLINNAALQAARANSARNTNLLLPQQQGRGSGIPVYRSNAANLWRSAAGKIVTCNAKSKSEAAKTATANREMSPVRWCDEEVEGVYLGRSGWVQVYNQRPASKPSTEPEAPPSQPPPSSMSGRLTRPESLNLTNITGNNDSKPPQQYARNTDPMQQYSRKTEQYSRNNESMKQYSRNTDPQHYSRSVSAPVDPGPAILLSDDEHLISLHTPIISPPLAFQDDRDSKPIRNKLPRSNAFDFPDPDEVTKAFLASTDRFSPSKQKMNERFSPTKKPQQQQPSPSKLIKGRESGQESSGSSTGSFRTAASSGGMRSVTPSWRGRQSCESCSSGSRGRSSSEESLVSPDVTPKSSRHRHTSHTRYHGNSGQWRHNGVLHLSDSNTPAARKHAGSAGTEVSARRTVTSPESSTSSASSSPARPERMRSNRLELPNPNRSRSNTSVLRAQSSGGTRHFGSRLSPQSDQSYVHVKRSSSLQLPAHADFPPAINYRDQRLQREAERINYQQRAGKAGPKARSVDEEGSSAGWHHSELRAVTDYLSSSRSRNAARALLLQRYLNQQGANYDEELASELLEPPESSSGRHSSASFNVVYVENSGKNKPPRQEKIRENIKTRIPWTRGSSAPLQSTNDSDEESNRNRHQTSIKHNTKYQQCCNPATCDFWPECEHQISTTPTTTTSTSNTTTTISKNNGDGNRKPYLCQIRPSLSYPSPCNSENNGQYQRTTSTNFQPQSKRIRDRSITAPCSLDRVDEDKVTSHVKTITIPKRDIYTKVEEPPCSPVEKNGFRNSSSDDLSTSADDLDEKWTAPAIKTPQGTRKSPSGSINKQLIIEKSSDSDSPAKKSTNGEESNPNLLTPTGRPHSADCLLRRRQYGNNGHRAHSERNSPIVEETTKKIDEEGEGADGKGAQQRSLSLPKSFLSNRQPARPKISSAWQGQHSGEDSEDGLLRVSAYQTAALSTPNTPGHVTHKPDSGNDKSCFGNSGAKDRCSPGGSGTNFLSSALRQAGLTTKQRRNSSEQQLSVLQKFKKTIAQKFSRNKKMTDPPTPGTPDNPLQSSTGDSPLIQDLLLQQQANQLDTEAYFKRIGPAWRQQENSSASKSCRNSKCSSADSGCQVEECTKGEGETEAPCSEEATVQRRVKSPADKRPLSEVINDTFLDKYKEDRACVPPAVRRTHSDLGSTQLDCRLLQGRFKRQISSPSPLKMRPQHCLTSNMGSTDLAMNSASEDDLETNNVVLRRTSAASTDSNVSVLSATPIQRQQQLRRSISQPMGMNELSPLLRRRPSGIPSVIPRRVPQRRRVRGRRRSKAGAACSEDELQRAAASSDYSDSEDSECSSTSSLTRKHSYDIRPLTQIVLAEAVWDHVTMDTEELAFKAGQLIEVVDCTSDKDWWFGQINDKKGWFPAAFVRFRVSQEDTVEDCLASMAAGKAPSPCEAVSPIAMATSPSPGLELQVTDSRSGQKKHSRTRSSVSLMSNDQVRASVVREILNTERDFVRNLTDVVEGYLWECRRRDDLFSTQQLTNIFGNIEELLEFQTCFLANLETKVNVDNPTTSCLGQIFLQHSSGFHIYSEYCNGHPIAQATLQELYAQPGYKQFFEACRLVRGLINISLDGFLLTPVQRICKYPLQLGELLKYTRADHADYDDVRAALEAMRSVATLVNERKRRMESLEKLAAWQQRVEGWEGEDLIDLSSQLIHQGEAVRVTSGRWSSNVKLFLFDRQLLYCKRDLLRRGLFVYKGRIALDHCTVMDVPDGKDIHLGISVRHGIKLVSRSGPSGRPPVSRGAVQWLLLCFRSADEKVAWLHALTEERQIVASEQARGLQLEPSARELARLLTNRQNTRPAIKPNAKSYSKRRARQGPLVPHLASSETSLGSSCQSFTEANQHSLGRKVGHWFTFSSSKKQHRRGPVSSGGSLQQLVP